MSWSGDPTITVSVCIVTAGRPQLLDACLASLRAQGTPPTFELLVCANGDDATAAVVRAHFPDAVVGLVGSTTPGAARNFLVERARGELLLFLDDDVVVAPDLLHRLALLGAAWPDVALFGGPNETPPGSSRFQVVQGAVLSSLVGAGPVRRRYGRHPAGPADERFFTLCNLAVRRTTMLPFPTDVVCAEENVLLHELRERGAAMRYDPDLVVAHERRSTGAGFAAQMLKYGHGRGQLTRRSPRTIRPAFVAPVALVLYLSVLPVLASWDLSWLAPMGIYMAAVTIGALRIAWTLGRPTALPLAAALIVVLHVCYGAGVFRGLADGRTRIRQPVRQWTSVGGAGYP